MIALPYVQFCRDPLGIYVQYVIWTEERQQFLLEFVYYIFIPCFDSQRSVILKSTRAGSILEIIRGIYGNFSWFLAICAPGKDELQMVLRVM